ncbi:dihydropteroate synthase [Parapedomonas caeni]|jgi:dihydropteroate synthase
MPDRAPDHVPDPVHDIAAFAALPADARIYLRPTGFTETPFDDPAGCRRLAGGLTWFGLVQVIARVGVRRVASVVMPVADVEALIARLPEAAQARAVAQWQALCGVRAPLALRGGARMLRFDRPHVMGILNLTPDSFSDGGRNAEPVAAAGAAFNMAADGAALVDVGAESTRPGAKPVWEGDEIERLRPVVARFQDSELLWSIDTRKAAVMRFALAAGAAIVNDVSALTYDEQALGVVAASECPVVLMHHQGDPQSMQDRPQYDDALLDVYDWLAARIAACEAAGIARTRLIVDPGIGFGKSVRHNMELLNGLGLFHALGCPILLGVSRKRFVGALSRGEDASERLPGTLVALARGLDQGAQLLRVHDVPEAVQALKVWQGMRDAALSLAIG